MTDAIVRLPAFHSRSHQQLRALYRENSGDCAGVSRLHRGDAVPRKHSQGKSKWKCVLGGTDLVNAEGQVSYTRLLLKC